MIRAAVLRAPEKLEVTSFPESPPPLDGAVLRVTHCGVCGTDPHMYTGHLAVPIPLVMGHEFAGVLERLGPDFPARDVFGAELRPGDPVVVGTTLSCGTCYYCRFLPQRENLCQKVDIYGITLGCEEEPFVRGGYADLTYLFPQTWLFKLPGGVSLKMAALSDPIACGTRAIERAFAPGMPWAGEGMGLGRSVVVQGLGPIGILTGAAARAMGARPVIGIDRIPIRMKMARRFGFDEVLSLDELPEIDDRVRAVRGMTRGLGADVVVEVVGLPEAFAESIRLVRKGGKIVEFGHFTDNGTMALNPQDIVNLDVDILGSYAYPNSQIGTSLSFLSGYADVYPFEELVTHTFGVDATEQAIQASREKRCVKAMVVSEGYG
ncbi:MAG: zinc-dependent alcohol dehydrogenase [Actinomycetota bacterium]